ncbi:hypothetical protein C8R45DRAFT_181546 [Mycena sanguinolenta]|nr:hypothetical protein C8R45DRAFT_181546 [Mycena sanguinolenta]
MSASTVPRSASTSAHSPYTTSPSPLSFPVSNVEPDEAWKEKKRREITDGMQPMIQDAKDRLEAKIQALDKRSPEFAAQKEALFNEFQDESSSIKALAMEEFMHSVANERLMRGMTLPGVSVNATVMKSLEAEQEAIYAQIQKARRDSTTSSGPQASTSPKTSDSPVTGREAPQTAAKSRSSQHETSRPTIVRASSASSVNVPVRGTPPTSSSPQTTKSPIKPQHPDPPPIEIHASSIHHPIVPPSPANEARFGSMGRTTASPVQERKMSRPGPGVSPAPAGSPTDNRRMSTSAAAPSPSSSFRTSTSPPFPQASASARHEPSRPSAAPHQERPTQASAPSPSPTPSYPHPSSARTIDRKTSQTWKEATSNPIPIEPSRPAPSSLNSKRSQSNFQSVLSNSGMRSEVWTTTELTEEPEEELFGRSAPLASERSRATVLEEPLLASSPPASRAPPQVWTPSISPEEDALGPRRDRNGSGSRSAASNARKPIPSSFVDATPPAPPAVDVQKNAEREAAQRQETERLWENLDRSREKEKEKERVESLGRAGGARLSTASEQLPRQNEHVSGGSTSQTEGSSMSTRLADSNPRSFPYPTPSPKIVDPLETIQNPSSFRSQSRPSGTNVPNGISTAHLPNVSPSSFGYSPTTEEEEDDPPGSGLDSSDSSEEDTDPSPFASPTIGSGGNRSSAYSFVYPERLSGAGPPSSSPPIANGDGRSVHSSYPQRKQSNPDFATSSPSPVAGGGNRSSAYSYTFPSHSAAVPIPIPPRPRSPEDEEPVAYSAGEYSRWGTPQRDPRAGTDSLRGPPSSFSFRDQAMAERERVREQERVREEERKREEREREEQEREEREREQQRVLEAERIAKLAEEAERKAEEIKRKEEAAQKKEAELRRQQEETERKLREITEREADLRRREAEVRRREEETRQKELARQREEAEKQKKEKERQQAEAERQRKDAEKQFQYEQQAAEIKRRAEERKRQGSVDPENSWSGASYASWGTPSRGTPASPSPSNATSSSTRSSTTGSSNTGTWSGSSKTSSTSSTAGSQAGSRASASASASSTSKPTPRTSTTSPPNPGPTNAEDWARRQQQQAEEQFRKMQEQMERERQAKEQKAGRMLSKDDVVRIYQLHDQQWSKMAAHAEITWDMLPWPMYKKPSSAEEITSGAVDAYIMSPHYPDQDKSTKDRVRQQLRRWHEDHFNQKVLSKVSERDKARVKEAAGTVTRNLNNLLERTNESKKAGSSVFG